MFLFRGASDSDEMDNMIVPQLFSIQSPTFSCLPQTIVEEDHKLFLVLPQCYLECYAPPKTSLIQVHSSFLTDIAFTTERVSQAGNIGGKTFLNTSIFPATVYPSQRLCHDYLLVSHSCFAFPHHFVARDVQSVKSRGRGR